MNDIREITTMNGTTYLVGEGMIFLGLPLKVKSIEQVAPDKQEYEVHFTDLNDVDVLEHDYIVNPDNVKCDS